jgi:hypothetical protein
MTPSPSHSRAASVVARPPLNHPRQRLGQERRDVVGSYNLLGTQREESLTP